MKFHEWRTGYQVLKANFPKGTIPSYEDYLDKLGIYDPSVSKQLGTRDELTVARARTSSEEYWRQQHSPYYNVWPIAVEPMQKVPLDLVCEHILPFSKPIAIRFPVGQEPKTSAGTTLCSILTFGTISTAGKPGMAVLTLTTDDADNIHFLVFPLNAGKKVEESIDCLPDVTRLNDDDETVIVNKLATRFALALCLMKDDPSLVIPDVLADDRVKFDETGDQKYVEKARRRGKVGWNVGSHLEVDPHFRRAHFGLRWTGEGRKIPRIVPIKGCIVKRSRLTQVPSGFQGQEV